MMLVMNTCNEQLGDKNLMVRKEEQAGTLIYQGTIQQHKQTINVKVFYFGSFSNWLTDQNSCFYR